MIVVTLVLAVVGALFAAVGLLRSTPRVVVPLVVLFGGFEKVSRQTDACLERFCDALETLALDVIYRKKEVSN